MEILETLEILGRLARLGGPSQATPVTRLEAPPATTGGVGELRGRLGTAKELRRN